MAAGVEGVLANPELLSGQDDWLEVLNDSLSHINPVTALQSIGPLIPSGGKFISFSYINDTDNKLASVTVSVEKGHSPAQVMDATSKNLIEEGFIVIDRNLMVKNGETTLSLRVKLG